MQYENCMRLYGSDIRPMMSHRDIATSLGPLPSLASAHVLHVPIRSRSPIHPWPAPTSVAHYFQVPTSAHSIIHLLPLDMPEPPQSTTVPRLVTSTTPSIPSILGIEDVVYLLSGLFLAGAMPYATLWFLF